MALDGQSTDRNPAVTGNNTADGTGVLGHSTGGIGVSGTSDGTNGMGVYGRCHDGIGVAGENRALMNPAVRGISSAGGIGVFGESKKTPGIPGDTGDSGNADDNININGIGVLGKGVRIGIQGEGALYGGFFAGNVGITGNLTVQQDIILENADCAEDFDIQASTHVEPGTVVVLKHGGALRQSASAYDKRVVGVISGAGNWKPGIILDKQGMLPNRQPVALMGKVYCKVDADHSPIEAGDLLTTSDRPGHAMKAIDHERAFGAVIGKALFSLDRGCGLLPILIALQ